MTQKVHPSFDRNVRNRELTAAIAYGGGTDGWISQAGERLVEGSEGDLPGGDLGTFDFVNSSGLTVSIGAGEAVVEGAHIATDETFTVDLDASTNNQTVYVGWRDGQADTIIVGLDSTFSDDDHRIKVWSFDANASSITSSTSMRRLGRSSVYKQLRVKSEPTTDLDVVRNADRFQPPVFGDGSGGDVVISSDTTITDNIYATSITVESGVTVTVNANTVALLATGGITLNGTIDASGNGAVGGNGGLGGTGSETGDDGVDGQQADIIGANGQGGTNGSEGGNLGGGGAGGRTDELHGEGGDSVVKYPDAQKTISAGFSSSTVSDIIGNTTVVGSGGGGGGGGASTVGDDVGGDGGDGGDGGGGVLIASPSITGDGYVDVSGTDGGNGGDGSAPDSEGGGGGGGGGGDGGGVIIIGYSLNVSAINADISGGVGGVGGSGANGGDGGDGGDGAAGIFETVELPQQFT